VPTPALVSRLCLLLALVLAVFSPLAVSAKEPHGRHAELDAQSAARRARLASVTNWGIQLRRNDAEAIHRSPYDLVVVDYAPYRHLTFEFPFTPGDVRRMQERPGVKRRVVLSYLSIGEAEDYRYYWRPSWYKAATKPTWLGKENKAWPGNFPVRFWDKAWRDLVFAGAASYLDRIIDAGFDGVYLDRADVYQEWLGEKRDADVAMAAFITELARHAHARRPDFLIVLQNAEELLSRPAVHAAIDGFAKEDLYLGATKDGEANAAAMVETSRGFIKLAQKAGVKTLVLEYPRAPLDAAAVRAQALRDGFLIHLAERSLTRLTLDTSGAPPVMETDAR
jgi:cysteinyl-tRNA synthetase, unknown class